MYDVYTNRCTARFLDISMIKNKSRVKRNTDKQTEPVLNRGSKKHLHICALSVYSQFMDSIFYCFRFFPPFDLVKVVESNTAVLKRLTQNQGLCNAFIEKYKQLFDDFLQEKAYRELYQT